MGHGGRGKGPSRRTYTGLIVGVSVALVVAGAFYALFYEGNQNGPPALVVDWRAKITFHDANTGTNYTLPANIGTERGKSLGLWENHTLDRFGPPGYSPVSTRDESGIIYIQSNTIQGFTFEDFFNVWGQRFDRSCVPDGKGGEYCTSATNPPPIMTDGSTERCIDPRLYLSNNKDWIIGLGSNLGTGC